MKSALKPALEDLDDALQRLEEAVDARLRVVQKAARKEQEVVAAPQLDLSVRNERDVSRKIAAKLDQTINRLEMLLAED